MTFKIVYCYSDYCRLARTKFIYSSNTQKSLKINFKNSKKLTVNTDNIYIIPSNYIEKYFPFQNNKVYFQNINKNHISQITEQLFLSKIQVQKIIIIMK